MNFSFPSLILLLGFVFLSLPCLSLSGETVAPSEGTGGVANKKTKSGKKDSIGYKWGDINYDELDKEWEDGDDPELLEHEFEVIRRIQAKRQPKINMDDPKSIRKAYDSDPFAFSGGGGQMLFVNLVPKADGSERSAEELEKLGKKWTSLMKSGGLLANCFNTGDGTLLVNMERSWNTKDVMQFLAMQPEMDYVHANNKKYTADDLLDDDFEDEEL